jgi:5-methylcytosine-specific restriction endonuclease McrA
MPKLGSSDRNAIVFSRAIPVTLRTEALSHNVFTCHMCGLGPGEIDSTTGRRARLHVDHLIDKSHGGKDKLSNLWATCSICIQGTKSITTEKPSVIWLLSQVRRAGPEEQLAVLNWLSEKFKY